MGLTGLEVGGDHVLRGPSRDNPPPIEQNRTGAKPGDRIKVV